MGEREIARGITEHIARRLQEAALGLRIEFSLGRAAGDDYSEHQCADRRRNATDGYHVGMSALGGDVTACFVDVRCPLFPQ